MHPGQGPGLSLHDLGESGGTDTVSLLESEIPAHAHSLMSLPVPGDSPTPAGSTFARVIGGTVYEPTAGSPPLVPMHPTALTPAGGDQPHNNMQPYLAFYFAIALQGVYPPRT
jgi:microcystin-dependent protein